MRWTDDGDRVTGKGEESDQLNDHCSNTNMQRCREDLETGQGGSEQQTTWRPVTGV